MILIKTVDAIKGFEETQFETSGAATQFIIEQISSNNKWLFLDGVQTEPTSITNNVIESANNIILSNAINGG